MKISIDTKEDSHNDIKKVIKMLQHLIGEDSGSNHSVVNQGNIFDNPSPSLDSGYEQPSADEISQTSAFGAMFGDDSLQSTDEQNSSENNTEEQTTESEEPTKINMDKEIIPY